MIPWLDADEALRLHLALVEDSLGLLRAGARETMAAPFLAFSEPWEPKRQAGPGSLAGAAAGIARLPQSGRDLGERLFDTFRRLTTRGHARVVVIGSDSPTLPPAILRSAFAALRQDADVVLGPAEDGGYYLVGAARLVPEMFERIPWGTDRVLAATLAALDRSGARTVLMPRWYDVDHPQDLDRVRADLSAAGGVIPRKTAAFVRELVRAGRLPCRTDFRQFRSRR
jgi:rSAM/selenodomain-associated transferase 1